MRWTSLGHAGWLAEAGGLRILCDPLLGDALHGGIHLVQPPRRVDVDALRPDVIVVSHVHPDHFDVPSLARLGCRYPDAPVLTADALVAESCRRLGFQTASVLGANKALELGAVLLLTTRSLAPIDEWGIALAAEGRLVWNQVDSVLDAATVAALRRGFAEQVGTAHLDAVLAHWNPIREIQAVTAGDLGFPTGQWAAKLAAIAALDAPAIVPTAAGFRHTEPFGWRDAHVFPVTEAALTRDLALAASDTVVLPCPPGSTLVVEDGGARVETGSPLCAPLEPAPLRAWAPLAIPEVSDPALGGETPDGIRAEVGPWLDELRAAIASEAPRLGRPLRLVLDVVLPDGDRDIHLFTADADRVERRTVDAIDPDHDALVVVAGSMLADVIAGRRHWGEPLLAGVLRSVRRLLVLPAMFPYWALSYRSSVERWVDHQIRQVDPSS